MNRSPDFEGTRLLKILPLQVDLGSGSLTQLMTETDGGCNGDFPEILSRLVDSLKVQIHAGPKKPYDVFSTICETRPS